MELNNNINTENQNINSTGSTTNTASSSSSSQTTTQNTSIMEKSRKDLLEKLGITEAEFMALYSVNPEFATMSLEKQLEFISKHSAQKTPTDNGTTNTAATTANQPATAASESSETAKTEQTQTTSGSEQTQTAQQEDAEGYFDKTAYNELNRDKKINVYVEEYAKNAFMFGDEKNHKTAEEWDALSDKEKRKLIQESYKKLSDDFAPIVNSTQRETVKAALDGMMTDIQAANKKGLNMAQFYGQEKLDGETITESQRKDYVADYLKDVQANASGKMSDIDKIRLKEQTFDTDALTYLTGTKDAKPSDVAKYLHDNNITKQEFEYTYLNRKKNEEGLSAEEEKRFQGLSKAINSPNMKQARMEAKAQGLANLEKERAEALKNGDSKRVAELDKVLNSEDSQDIREWAKENVFQKSEPPKSYQRFRNSKLGKLYEKTTDPDQRSIIMMAYIKQRYPEKKWGAVAEDMLKGISSEGPESAETKIAFLSNSMTAFDYMKAKKVMDEASSANTALALEENLKNGKNVDSRFVRDLSLRQSEEYTNAENQMRRRVIQDNIRETQNNLKVFGNDNQKFEAVIGYQKLNSNDSIGTGNVDLSISIEDSEKERDAITATRKNASQAVLNYGVRNGWQLDKANQIYGTELFAKGNAEATTILAEEGVWSKFHDDNIVDGAKMTNNLIENEKSFDDDKKIELLNKSSDYVSEVDKSKQLELHELYANNKYSEVQEHAASNIYKYDESVQGDALDVTKATGNEKAIDAAMGNYDKYADSVQENPKYQAMQRETEVRQSEEVAKQVAEFHVQYEKLTGMKSNIDQAVSDTEQKMSYVKDFLNASPQEQFKMLSKVPMSWQGTVFSKIAQYCPQMLTSMVKQGYGKHILNTPGLSSEVIYKVINVMLMQQTSDKKVAVKYVKSHQSMFSDSTIEKCEEIMAGDKNKNRNYASLPASATVKGALQPKMSAVYENQEEMFYQA